MLTASFRHLTRHFRGVLVVNSRTVSVVTSKQDDTGMPHAWWYVQIG